MVSEQSFFNRNAILSMPHSTHGDGRLLARGLDKLPGPDRHGLGKGAGHDIYHGDIFA